MTIETTPTTDQAPAPVLELVEADPATLVIGANVRPGKKPSKAFVASIKARGVLEPVVAYREDGQLVVWRGQRRTLGAIQAGRAVIPVVVVAKPAEVDRLVDQIVENEHREAMTGGELAGGYGQLSAMGVPAGQIATQTAARKADVEAGLIVAGSELATKAAERYELTLDQAAAIAEFQDDAEAAKALVVAAKSGGFEHVVQQIRDSRDEQEALTARCAELTEQGVTVIERPDYESVVTHLSRLAHDNEPITEESHQGCPGHAACVSAGWGWRESGLSVVYYCTDPTGNGHTSVTGGPVAGPRGGAMTEAEKAERRRVIDGNRAWRSAATVRRDWLRTFVTRKTPPEGAERFVLIALLRGDHDLRRAMEANNRHRQLRDLLGLVNHEETNTWAAGSEQIAQLVTQAGEGTPKRAVLLAVALLLAAWEDTTGPHTWRNPNEETRRYLSAMNRWGYQLSEIEQPLVADQAAD